MSDYLLAHGDALRLPLADRSVHLCVTSPPYYGLRDYSTPGQLGLEPSPEAFVAAMVAVFAEVKRVLRDDGTCWVNLGDSMASGVKGSGGTGKSGLMRDGRPESGRKSADSAIDRQKHVPVRLECGLASKQLLGIPWRVAFALQADGWILRSDIIWHKPNPMPESVTDRPTKAHEYIFLLAKSSRYFYDADAVREKAEYGRRSAFRSKNYLNNKAFGNEPKIEGGSVTGSDPSAGRNKRSVWTIATKPFKGADFATFPTRLVEPCIKAGTSQAGCCPGCGTPWRRLVERERSGEPKVCPKDIALRLTRRVVLGRGLDESLPNTSGLHSQYLTHKAVTLGWAPTCSCPSHDPVSCTVLDPFAGAASVGVAATALGRRFVGVDLSPKYLRMARRRLERPHARPEPMVREEALPLFAHLD